MPRPQVKDLFERIGRPQIKPQASTETYGYSQPAATSRSNDLTQLGGLMKEFSEAASDWADVLIKKEVKEGEEEGRIRALSDKRKGLQTLIENSNNLVKDGKLPHGLNWFAVKAYHRNAGALFAQDRTTANILNEGVSEWMADKISNEDLTFPQLRQQLYSDVVIPRLNELRDQLPNSRMARNIGFDESIQPVLDKLNESWEKDYEVQVYEKNLDTFSQLVTSKLREGNFDEALELFSPNLDTTDYPLGTGLDPRTNKRAVMFGLFKNYIENDLISSDSLGDYKLKEIDDATDSLKSFMQKREKGSNAKVGDYNVIGEGISKRPYHDLLRELKRQRRITVDNLEAENLALSKEAQIQFADALLANQEFFIDRFERQYEGTVVLPQSGEQNLGIKDANAKVPVGEVNAGLNMRAVKINKTADA